MSFGSPNNPYGQPQDPQQGYGYPQQPGYPQAPQGVPPQQGYGYPQAPQGGYPGYPQQPGYGMQPTYANWGQRFLARLLDSLLYAVPYGIAIAGAKNAPFLAIIGFLALIGLFVWQIIMEGKTGQTVGKKALGIRTLKEETGQPLGGGMAFVRQLAHILDGLPCYLGYLWPAWDAKRQTFADKVCGSIVIRSN
ncbi:MULTISPECIES: RDD family protein [unclassified Streptomyces]|uniref:RDD family protein n=1 Tax=unclassified Streptomyces TaxID=2593676 RepID=UPI0011A4AFB7|nr:RDD family protein [Streptomyces sp. BK340]TVZ93381.1 putative RDD family membrane protein YckC [Streptomyces sp. BK340]